MRNVATYPAYAKVVAELRQRLLGELERTADPRLVDDSKFFATPPMAGPIAQDAENPQLKR